MSREALQFAFLNVGHFLDHLFVLIFATVALHLVMEWEMSYAELIPYATPGFVAFGMFAIPAGWLADHWSREGMMVVFFIGIGACSILAGMAETPLQMAIALTLVGSFAAIYHPVGLAMAVQGVEKTGMRLAVNGVFGNMGVAVAALLTGYIVARYGWSQAFVVPGALSIALGLAYWLFVRSGPAAEHFKAARATQAPAHEAPADTGLLLQIFAIILFTTAIGGVLFQSTTFALPKVLEEELSGTGIATIGVYAFAIFAVAAFAQLVVGYLVDNYSARNILACVALTQAVFFFLMTRVDGLAALIVAGAFMLAVFGQIPINDVLVGRIASSAWRSRAYGLRYVVTFTVMSSALPFIAWIHSNWGFERLFLVLSFLALSIFLAALLLPDHASVRRPSLAT